MSPSPSRRPDPGTDRHGGVDAVDVRPFGVYVHIPFCASKCEYCAFATWTDRPHLIDRYLDALEVDVRRRVADGLPVATSVFVGGGTPSMVPADRLAEVIASIPVADGAEITVECNPDHVDAALVATLASGGVNRISLGVQSTAPHVLAALGRTHDVDHVARAVDALRAARGAGLLRSFNLDLIFGAVGESADDWRRTVGDVVAMEPPHVSAYALMAEPGTPVGADPARHPDDDDQADKYTAADDLFGAAGLDNYEVSNWSLPGHESVHNRLYWDQGDYLGVGCAAHSHRDGRRWWNVRTPERYIGLVERGDDTEATGETLDDATRRFERVQLALRTRDGVERSAFAAAEHDRLSDAGLLAPHPGDSTRVVLTRAGRLLANEVGARVSEAVAYDAAEGA